jgi:hypothetical protein
MPQQPSDAAKKPKLVGNSDIAYTDLPLDPSRTPTNEPVGWVLNTLLDRSAAARLHASTYGSPPTHNSQAPLNLASLDAPAPARSQNPHPQAALSVTSPASRRIRTSPSSCCAGSHVTSPPTLAAATPTPNDTTPTPQTLPTPRKSFFPPRVCSLAWCCRFFPPRFCRTSSLPSSQPRRRAHTRRNSSRVDASRRDPQPRRPPSLRGRSLHSSRRATVLNALAGVRIPARPFAGASSVAPPALGGVRRAHHRSR